MAFRNIQGVKTDTGRQRVRNEDAFGVNGVAGGQLLVVCDGMGGHPGGDLAAKIATTAIRSFFAENEEKVKLLQQEAIPMALKHGNDLIREAVSKHPTLTSMGTTCEVVFILEDQYHWGHIGDSRIYHLSKGMFKQITKDHSYVQQLIEQGSITADEARNHPRKNEISRCMGTEKIEPEYSKSPIKLAHGDIVMLCSDGLTNMVAEEPIRETLLKENWSVQEKAEELVRQANHNGGTDNITVILSQHFSTDAPKKKNIVTGQTEPFPAIGNQPFGGAENGKTDQKKTFLAFSIFFVLISFLYLQKHGFDGGINAQLKQKMDSVQLVNWRLQRQLDLNSEQQTEAFTTVRDSYFDPYDRNFYRMYGLFRDTQRKYSKTEISVMFNIFNPNAIESKEVQGERWFLVPVKGVHYFTKTESLSELANLYYTNPTDSNLIRKFNPQIKPNRYLFIPFSQ